MKIRTLALALALPLLAAGCSSPKAPEADKAPVQAKVSQVQKAPIDGRLAPAASLKLTPTPVDAEGKIRVEATQDGFSPKRIIVEEGKPVKLVFHRTVEKTCMDGVIFPSLGIEKELAVGVPVEVEITPEHSGKIAFQCPMGHGKSSIVVLPKS